MVEKNKEEIIEEEIIEEETSKIKSKKEVKDRKSVV